MAKAHDKFEGQDLKVVADFMAGSLPGSKDAHGAYTAFVYRNSLAQKQTAEAQRQLADSSKKSVKIMMLSVVVLALSSLVNLFITWITSSS